MFVSPATCKQKQNQASTPCFRAKSLRCRAYVSIAVVCCCRCQIEALSGTRDIIQREQKQLTSELANLKAFLVRPTHSCKPGSMHAPGY